MHDVGEQFAEGQMFFPDMIASAEAVRAATDGTTPDILETHTAACRGIAVGL